jgi:glycerophosphoryl diester phosphodiesterase
VPERSVIRVAHAYGNGRQRIEKALAAGVEFIEADLRYRKGEVDVRHDHRLPFIPVLYNRGLRGIHKRWPWSLTFGSTVVHVDLERLSLGEVLSLVSRRGGLMLDLKRDDYEPEVARAFVQRIGDEIEASGFVGGLEYCGYWPLLDLMRTRLPGATLRYSIDTPHDWEHLLLRLEGEGRIASVTMQRDLVTDEHGRLLREAGVTFFVWDIESVDEAVAAIEIGASGIIADDLDMLRTLSALPATRGA